MRSPRERVLLTQWSSRPAASSSSRTDERTCRIIACTSKRIRRQCPSTHFHVYPHVTFWPITKSVGKKKRNVPGVADTPPWIATVFSFSRLTSTQTIFLYLITRSNPWEQKTTDSSSHSSLFFTSSHDIRIWLLLSRQTWTS